VQRFGFEGPRESLVSLGLLLSFFNETPKPELHMKTVVNDFASLSDHFSIISTKIDFLLDATLGLINIEQNGIIKIFSVAAVVFLPPNLVASVYGMNFDVMPELKLTHFSIADAEDWADSGTDRSV
jgi:magnesium transporter